MNQPIGKLSADVLVTGQIAVDDVAELARMGVRTIVNNRPDGEEWGQPASEEIAAAAEAAGLGYVHIPVASHGITPQDVLDLRQADPDLERPVLLFCRSGARSAALWQMAGFDND